MKQIRIHGRGGQGVVTAAELVAIAAFKSGRIAQAFPAFGVERTGAPIESFARISDKEIRTREQVNEPDVLIIQDATLLDAIDVSRGSNKNTVAIINSSKPREKLKINLPLNNVYIINATEIALKNIGKNIVNTTILGAFAKATGLISLNALKEAIKEKFKEKGENIINKNINAIEEAYNINF
jgi:pyruvate ferredoxin oxidoreductase gamma subunit